jgi:hypothetical protein
MFETVVGLHVIQGGHVFVAVLLAAYEKLAVHQAGLEE